MLLLAQIPELYPLPGFQDPFSAISHLVGIVIFAVLGVLLLFRGRGERLRMGFLTVYVVSCVFLMSMSTVYHMLARGGAARSVLERLDHCAIFVLIAGTSTPGYGILFRGWQRWLPLSFVWICAITGLTLKTIFFENFPEVIGLSLYIALGWVGGLSAILLGRRRGWTFVEPLVFGGIAYTIGGVCEFFGLGYLIPGVVHPHEVFHILVLVGALLHYWFVWEIARLPASGPLS